MTTADILRFVAQATFIPMGLVPLVARELSDCSPGTLIAVDPTFKGEPGALRVYIIDPDQSSIDVLDLWSSINPSESDPQVRVTVSLPHLCG